MSERSYLVKLPSLEGTVTSEEGLLRFFEALNEPEWAQFLEDLVTDRPEAIEVLSPDRPENLTLYATIFLSRLGPATQRVIAQALERVLRQQVTHPGDVGRGRLLELFYLASSSPGAFLTPLLMDFCRRTDLPVEIRLAAAKALVAHASTVPLSFWEGIDLRAFPEMAAAVLSGLGALVPGRALSSLAILSSPPPNPENLESPLRMTLRRLLVDEEGVEQLREIRETVADWLRLTLDIVLGFREFASVRFLLESRSVEESAVWQSTRHRWDNDLELYLRGITQELPWDKRAVESEDTSLDTVALLERAVLRWKPFETHDIDYSLRLLDLLRTRQSLRILAALVSFLEWMLVERYNEEQTLIVAKQVLEVLESMRTAVRVVVAGASERDHAIWMSYYRCLRLALAYRDLAASALRQLVAHTAIRDELQVTLLNALEQDHISGEQCLDVLLLYYHESTCERILMRTLNFARYTPELPEEIPVYLKKAGVKLYRMDPFYVASPECKLSDAEKLLIEHEAVKSSFSTWSEDLLDTAELQELENVL